MIIDLTGETTEAAIDINFCVSDFDRQEYGQFAKTATVIPGKKYDLRFKGKNIPDESLLVFTLGNNDDPLAAITETKIGEVILETGKIKRQDDRDAPEELVIKNVAGLADIEFELRNFEVVNKDGRSEIKLKTDDEEFTLVLVKENEAIIPVINSFTADGYYVVNGSDVTLNWQVTDATGLALTYGDKTITLTSAEIAGRAYTVRNVQNISSFTLTATNGANSTVTIVEIKPLGDSAVIAQAGFFPVGSRVLSMFSHQRAETVDGQEQTINSMYAFVQASSSGKTATLYSAMPNPTQPWEKVINSDKQTVEIAADIAARPYAVLGNNLVFAGGSAYHPDVIADTYCVFDITQKQLTVTNILITDKSKNANIIPRMGHTCLLHNGSIWLLGGYNPDYEPFDDIWRYDGTAWHKLDEPLPFGRCLMAARSWTFTLNREEKKGLWIYGGYEQSPGGNRGTQLYYMDEQYQFIKVECTKETQARYIDPSKLDYNAVGLEVLKNKLYLFANGAYKIEIENNNWACTKITDNINNWVYAEQGHKLQTLTFANLTWLNALHDYKNEQEQNRLGKMFCACFI